MAKLKGAGVDKWKKKKWFTVFSPAEFNKKEIALTPGEKPEKLVGRRIRANLGDLTGQAKKQHVSMIFEINKVQGLNAFSSIVGMEVQPAVLKRMIRRRKSKIDISQEVRTKEEKKARVKSAVICNKKIARKKEKEIRLKVEEEIEKTAVNKSFEELVQEIIFGNLINHLLKSIKNIASIKRVEVMKCFLSKKA